MFSYNFFIFFLTKTWRTAVDSLLTILPSSPADSRLVFNYGKLIKKMILVIKKEKIISYCTNTIKLPLKHRQRL